MGIHSKSDSFGRAEWYVVWDPSSPGSGRWTARAESRGRIGNLDLAGFLNLYYPPPPPAPLGRLCHSMLDCSAEIPDGLQSHPINFMTAKDFVSTTTMTPARKGSYVASMLPRCTMGGGAPESLNVNW